MNRIIKILIIFFFLPFCLKGQNLVQLSESSKDFYNQKNYNYALFYAEKALELDPENIDLLYIKAVSEQELNLYFQSERSFQKLVELDTIPKYRDAYFKLGMLNKNLNNPELAGELFVKSSEILSEEDVELLEQTVLEIEACKWTIGAKNNPEENIKIERLGSHINTEYSEFSPFIWGDSLFYTSKSTFEQRGKKAGTLIVQILGCRVS